MIYEGTKWADRLNYLATVEDGWFDGQGDAVSPEVLDKTNQILNSISTFQAHLPALFPLMDDETDEGGISMEWPGLQSSYSISLQITNRLKYWIFIHNRETRKTTSLETHSFADAYQLLRDSLLETNFTYEDGR